MGIEINLMKNYPKSQRDTTQRLETKTIEDRNIARKFGKFFFDGERNTGYGGFSYNSRFWKPVIPTFKEYYNLDKNSKILQELKSTKMNKIAQTFSKMKANSAANVLSDMDAKDAASILQSLKPKVVGKILSKMDPKKASELTLLLAK
jgi:hypothetical protein